MQILKAMHAIMSDFDAVEKTRKGFQFQYRGIDDALKALRPLLVKHNVIVLPAVSSFSEGTTTTKKGATMQIATVHTSYRFISIEDGSEVVAGSAGQGADDLDKAMGKALSTAFKAMVWDTFCVPTEPEEKQESLDTETRTVDSYDDEKPAAKRAAPKKKPPEAAVLVKEVDIKDHVDTAPTFDSDEPAPDLPPEGMMGGKLYAAVSGCPGWGGLKSDELRERVHAVLAAQPEGYASANEVPTGAAANRVIAACREAAKGEA